METEENSSVNMEEVIDPQDKAATPLQTERERHPCELTDLDKKLETFTTWPKQMKQAPFFLVYCGYLYTGIGDCVKCWKCDKAAVCHWGATDDPLQVHETLSPDCPYILANKQTLIATIPQQQRYRATTDDHGCSEFDPAISDQPAMMVPLPEQVYSLHRKAFLSFSR